jgi:hypothetical protein
MTEELGDAPRGAYKWRKTSLQAVFGAAFGAGVMIALMEWVVVPEAALWESSHVVLAAVGLIYVLMALLVGIGTLAPRSIGRRLLNVSDAEELAEGRSLFLYSAPGCLPRVPASPCSHSPPRAIRGPRSSRTPLSGYSSRRLPSGVCFR